MRKSIAAASAVLCLWTTMLWAGAPATAQEPVSFRNKTVTLIVGYAPGGGTDVVGRLVGQYLVKHLPGAPSLVVQNMPGAEGVVAINYLVKQAKPDGLTLTIGVSTQVDPLFYPNAHAVYEPRALRYIGGTGRPGSALLISKKALPRLTNSSAPPVTMGALAALRASMQMALWGAANLHWNMKWVFGYPGTNALKLALIRGEVDMTALSAIADISDVLKTGDFSVLLQSGALQQGTVRTRSEFADAPLFLDMVGGGITDPVVQEALAYTFGMTQVGQWFALPPGTPDPIVAAYRHAYRTTFSDPEFRERLSQVDAELTEMAADEELALISKISATPPEVFTYMRSIARNQGVKMDE